MNTFSKFFICVAVALCASSYGYSETVVQLPEDMTVAEACWNAVVTNNDKMLSSKGRKLILMSELTRVGVAKDTIYITLKPEVLKRIDKDPSNYAKSAGVKKSSGFKKKK